MKVLPDAFAADAQRTARFEHEARTLAALNHPNIAQIYGVEERATEGGRRVRALVMELVSGSTLADRLLQGALALPEALSIAGQIVEGLEAAHDRGIVHRDLKPANIMVTADGQVKIVDFGLSKATQSGGASSSPGDVSLSPTMTSPAMTAVGMILGTAAYMSPEQAKGHDSDKRTDVWAFGCVLYEMLTGRRAFAGDDVAELIASVLRSNPDWDALPRDTPAAVRSILRRCLEKERKARIPDISVVRYQLEDAVSPVAGIEAASAPARMAWRERALWAALVVACALGASALGAWAWLRTTDAPQTVRFEVLPPDGARFTGANDAPRMAVSPDGRAIVFAVTFQDNTPDQLWIRRFDALEATRLVTVSETTGEPPQQPFWSPGSDFVGFFVAGALRTVEVATGVMRTLCDVPGNNYSGAWGPDGTILFGSSETRGIRRISAQGGTPTPVTTLDSSETWHIWPRFLPDGRRFLYMAQGGSTEARTIFAGSVDSPGRTRILDTPFMVEFAPPGLLVFLNNGPLLAQRFNTKTLALEDEPFTVAAGVQGNLPNGRAAFSTSNTGTLVYKPGTAVTRDSQLAWFDRSGRVAELVGQPERLRGFDLSPDGTRAAVHRETAGDEGDIRILDLQRGAESRLTFDSAAHNLSPAWSPDGQRVFFGKRRGDTTTVYEKNASGVGEERQLVAAPSSAVWPLSVAPDGRTVVLGKPTFGLALFDGTRTIDSGSRTSSQRTLLAQLSPDGRWLAYVANESGRPEVYLRSFPDFSTRYQVSTQGGTEPRWRGDSRELFYRGRFFASGAPKLLAVGVTETQTGLQLSAPTELFDMGTAFAEHRVPHFTYDVTADGQRFLVSRPAESMPIGNAVRPLVVVLNWNASNR